MSKSKKKNQDAPSEEPVEAVDAPQEVPEEVVQVVEDFKDKYLRTLAEFDNMRKRGERERLSARKYALEGLMRDLLPVLDSLEFAAGAQGDADAIREGIEIALAGALRVLQSHGLETIVSHGEVFDPRVHEAIGMIPHDELEAGRVAVEHRKGYQLADRVLRPSQVHIVIAPAVADDSSQNESDSADRDGEES